jgi:hypothetical protein
MRIGANLLESHRHSRAKVLLKRPSSTECSATTSAFRVNLMMIVTVGIALLAYYLENSIWHNGIFGSKDGPVCDVTTANVACVYFHLACGDSKKWTFAGFLSALLYIGYSCR